MFQSFYTFIIVLVQVLINLCVGEVRQLNLFESLIENIDPSLQTNKNEYLENKRSVSIDDEMKAFENIREEPVSTIRPQRHPNTVNPILSEIEQILKTLVVKIQKLEADEKKRSTATSPRPRHARATRGVHKSVINASKKRSNHQTRWGDWTPWSPCSVTCGKGRRIRWRHCLEYCDEAETEMEEKTCQLPACGPGRFFGIKL